MNMNMADEKLHILIIEDDYYVRELYERVLSNAGFDVFSAADGQEGYQLALRNPDLILLDIMLPGRNGLTVLRQLKDSDQTKNIPVIVLTNLGQQSTIKEAMESGAEEYLLKPEVDPYELAKRIQEYFDTKQVISTEDVN